MTIAEGRNIQLLIGAVTGFAQHVITKAEVLSRAIANDIRQMETALVEVAPGTPSPDATILQTHELVRSATLVFEAASLIGRAMVEAP